MYRQEEEGEEEEKEKEHIQTQTLSCQQSCCSRTTATMKQLSKFKFGEMNVLPAAAVASCC